MPDLEVNLKVFPRQAECIQALTRFMYVLFGGARGGGKSHLSRLYLVSRALRYANTRHLLIRKSFPELQRNHISRFLQDYSWMEYVAQHHEFRLPNGSIVECGFCESERDLQKWQGAEFATVCADEAQYHDRPIFNFLKTILRTSSPTGIQPRMLLTGNPGGYGWLKALFLDHKVEHGERETDFAFVKSLVTDNPALMQADPDYYERLKSLPPALRAAFLEGDWNAIIGAFFDLPPEMEEEPFDIRESDAREHLSLSIDHGIRHSTSSGLHYLDENGHIHRLFTYLNSGLDAETHAQELVDRIRAFPHTKGVPPAVVFYDPSMKGETKVKESVTSPLKEYQAVFAAAHMRPRWEPANNSRIFGSQMMQAYFKPPSRGGEPPVPKYRVWAPYNHDYRTLMAQIMCDPNNREVYLKEETPSDDLADDTRYAIVGIHGEYTRAKQSEELRAKARARQMDRKDWYTA